MCRPEIYIFHARITVITYKVPRFQVCNITTVITILLFAAIDLLLYIDKEEGFDIALAKLGKTQLLFLASSEAQKTIRDRLEVALEDIVGEKEKSKVYFNTFSSVFNYSSFIFLDV